MAIDTGDTGWVLGSAALVLFMTPGLALFYGGLVRSKNVLGTMMQSVAAIAIVSVVWVLAGYSLAFGPDAGGVIGGLAHLGFRGVGVAPHALAPTVPQSAFAAFQMMFAVITPALIAGAFAERVRFGGYVVFVAMWSLVVYAPLAHWVWGGGFLGVDGIGALDFAGGTVVHISAGAAALAAALYVGKRRGYPRGNFAPHNVPMVVLGAGILWFGWFGFNAGSALGANGLASSAPITSRAAPSPAARRTAAGGPVTSSVLTASSGHSAETWFAMPASSRRAGTSWRSGAGCAVTSSSRAARLLASVAAHRTGSRPSIEDTPTTTRPAVTTAPLR